MPRLLLVDDEPTVLGVFKEVLEHDSFQVQTAACAREAIAKLREESFEIVVTDLRMETPLAGYEVVKTAHALRPRPVIAIVTAFPVPTSDWKGVGADALFVKSGSILNLGKELLNLLGRFGAPR